MRKKMLLLILCFIVAIVIYNIYKYYDIMLQIDFNKDIYYSREWREGYRECKYYGVNNKKFDIDKYIKEWDLCYNYEYEINDDINTPMAAIEVLISMFDCKYMSGFNIYYDLNSNRWAIVPMYRNDIEYLNESMAIYIIHDDVLTFYWDGVR